MFPSPVAKTGGEEIMLYATALRGTATVVRQRSDVDNLGNLDTGTVDGTDGGLTSVARSLDISLHLTQTKVERHFGAILGSHLGGVGVFFFEPRKPILPADDQEIT